MMNEPDVVFFDYERSNGEYSQHRYNDCELEYLASRVVPETASVGLLAVAKGIGIGLVMCLIMPFVFVAIGLAALYALFAEIGMSLYQDIRKRIR